MDDTIAFYVFRGKGPQQSDQKAAPARPATVPVSMQAHGLLGPFSGTYQRQAHTMRPETTNNLRA
jgi:hypothetical protein